MQHSQGGGSHSGLLPFDNAAEGDGAAVGESDLGAEEWRYDGDLRALSY
jgi:hypothetical protein